MRVMEVSWPSPQVGTVSRLLYAIIGICFGLACVAAAQAPDEGWASNEQAHIYVFTEDGNVAVDWYWTGDVLGGATPRLSASLSGPGGGTPFPARLSLPYGEAGLQTAILYVMTSGNDRALAGQRQAGKALFEALLPGQTLHIVWQSGEGWRKGGLVETAETLDEIAIDENVPETSPTRVLTELQADRRFVIFARGDLATPDMARLARGIETQFYADTSTFPGSLPAGITALGDLTADKLAEAILTRFASGEVAVFQIVPKTRLPFEPYGMLDVRLDFGSGSPLSVSLPATPAEVHDLGWGALINPIQGIGWLGIPGRRIYGLTSLTAWVILLGGLGALGYGLTQNRSEPLAEIELYGLGLSVTVDRLPFKIGRASDCDLVIPDDETSRHHAELRRVGEHGIELVDLGSANGTYLESDPVASSVPLGDRQTVTFGAVRGHIRLIKISEQSLEPA